MRYKISQVLASVLFGTWVLVGCGGNSTPTDTNTSDAGADRENYYVANTAGTKEALLAKKSLKEAFVSGDYQRINSFTFTPKRGGVVVLMSGDHGEALKLYGLEDPSNPKEEYTIASTPFGDTIDHVTMLGSGKISFEKHHADGTKETVLYNYFDKEELSNISQSVRSKIEDYLLKSLDNKPDYTIEEVKAVEDRLYVVRYKYSTGLNEHQTGPKKGYVTLLLKVPENAPAQKVEKLAFRDSYAGVEARNIAIDTQNKWITYSLIEMDFPGSESRYYRYNYQTNKRYLIAPVAGSEQGKVIAYIYKSNPESDYHKQHPDEPMVRIRDFKPLEEGLYLVGYDLDYFDARMRLDLFKVTKEGVSLLHKIEDEKEGEGGLTYSNLVIDRDAYTLSYISWDTHDPEMTKARVMYNYETGALTRTPIAK